ncbi:NADP-dependent oxidoreductase [Kribbella sp. NBC_00382]|uniref:NADP-dependent oxidoreductase n=1 Tax=Kribbella sp. NBC_00382 TaxID=2975967 RepID=UPI002E1C284D
MTTMQAVVAQGIGGPEVLSLQEVERPVPGLTEILVRVHAAGINPTDWKARALGGRLADGDSPVILGYDVAGVVEEVGGGVTWLRVGDEVLGMPRFPVLPGGYAEYVVAPSRQFVRKPAALSFEQAAGLPLAALTAWQGLVDTARLSSGQRVLVHAAAGGVGHLAVQIAKSLGAYVIGTASAPKHDFVRSLGADEVIDYRGVDFVDVLRERPVDVVFDPIAGDTSLRSVHVLKDAGTLVSILDVEDDAAAEAKRRGIHADFTLVEPDRLALTAITDLVEQGRLRVEIDSVFPLAEAADAHRRGETNQASGKIILRVC